MEVAEVVEEDLAASVVAVLAVAVAVGAGKLVMYKWK